MADLKSNARDELASKFDCPRCAAGGKLSAAPNDAMPNPNEYDFRCKCGLLYNLTDLADQV